MFNLNISVITASLCTAFFSLSANAALFDWTSGSVTRNNDSFSLTVEGITATARAYTTQWNATTSQFDISGPFLTSPGFTTANPDGFLIGGEGLNLEESQNTCGTGNCAIDNRDYGTPGFDFVLISFDQVVDLDSLVNSRLSNYDFDFWLASSDTAPDLNQDFISAFSGFTTSGHPKIPGDLQGATGLSGTHSNLSYLAIGAPIDSTLGSFPTDFLNLDNSDHISITSQTVGLASVPIPATIWLFGSGLLGLFGATRRKKAI